MAKRGKLSKVETCYIENNRDKTVAEIALELDRTESAVEKHLATLPEVEVEVQEEQPRSDVTSPIYSPDDNPMRQAIGRRTKEGRGGVAIWNAAASQQAESTRDRRVNQGNRHTKDAIHKPFGD